MTDPIIKDLFDRHSEKVYLEWSSPKLMTLDQFRAALTEFAPKRPSDEEIKREASSEYPKANSREESDPTEFAERMGFIQGAKWAIDRIFGQETTKPQKTWQNISLSGSNGKKK